jgi:hypothetical protein
MKQLLKWILGLFLLLTALMAFTNYSYLSFAFFILAAIFCIPPSMRWIETNIFKENLKSVFKLIVVIGSCIIGVSMFYTSETSSKNEISDKKENSTSKGSESNLDVIIKQKEILENSFDSIAKANSLKMYKDEFKPDLTFYQPINAPKYRNVSWLYPYLVKSENDIYLRYVIQYEADDWLFIENVKLKITYKEGNEKIIDLYSGRFEQDNDNGRIWEWIDTEVSDAMYIKLKDLNNAKTAKIRFEGRQYYKERNMTANEFKALKNAINVYKLVKE